MEFPQAILQREVLRIPMREDDHGAGVVCAEEILDTPASFPELGFQYLDVGIEPVYRPLDDRDQHQVGATVGHDGPRQLSAHLADPNWSLN